MSNVISKSNIISDITPKYKSIEKRLYIDCICGAFSDAARVVIMKNVFKDDNNSVDKSVIFEFNTQRITGIDHKTYICGSVFNKISMKIIRILKRISLSLKILLGLPVYLPSDIIIDFPSAEVFCAAIKESVDEIEKFKL